MAARKKAGKKKRLKKIYKKAATKRTKSRAKKASSIITAAQILQNAKNRFNKTKGPKILGMCHFRAEPSKKR